MRIVYVGTKEIKADNVTATLATPGTGLVWKRGEIHEVANEKQALKLLEHPVWKNADEKYELMGEPVAVPAQPRVVVQPESTGSQSFWEPEIIVVPAEVFKKVQAKELQVVFMTQEDADAFSEWKLDRDTSPRNTGPRPQAKDTKVGLDSKAGLDAKKKVA